MFAISFTLHVQVEGDGLRLLDVVVERARVASRSTPVRFGFGNGGLLIVTEAPKGGENDGDPRALLKGPSVS